MPLPILDPLFDLPVVPLRCFLPNVGADIYSGVWWFIILHLYFNTPSSPFYYLTPLYLNH